MSFSLRIKNLFGAQELFEGVVNENAFLFLNSSRNRKQDELIDIALKGDVVAIFMSSLLIDFFRETEPACKSDTYDVYFFDKTKNESINAYGQNKAIYKIIKKGNVALKEDSLIKDPKVFEGDYKIYVGNDSFTQSLIGQEIDEHISIARIIKAEIEGEAYAWKKKQEKLAQNPLIALAQAMNMYGEKCFIMKNGTIYQSPEIVFNEQSMPDKKSLDLMFLYSFIKELKDAFAYYMSYEGRALKLIKNSIAYTHYFNKEVIVPQTMIHKEWKEDIDYTRIDDIAITKLSNWLLSNDKKEIFLTYSDKSYYLNEHFNMNLREISLEKKQASDVKVNFTKTKDEYALLYKIGSWRYDLFPIVYKEFYAIADFEEKFGYMLEP
ncbi:MAG: hypothetical protein QXI89_01585 [Candidatus Anstonellales archaeon]